MLTGSCLCGDIRFHVTGAATRPAACHCSQCRKMSGHYWAAATVALDDIDIIGEPRWYEASETARRGFCPRCGSFLFWQANGSDQIDFALGAVDGPTGLKLERHIFTASKGDYYEIADGLVQEPGE